MNYKLDTDTHCYFYEQEFYPLSNFSSFAIWFDGDDFRTSEHAYQAQKFKYAFGIFDEIVQARSAHDAYALAQKHKAYQREGWDKMKVPIMKAILWDKLRQHKYVEQKLIATGDRQLVEDSWRDDFWGWGPKTDGQNMLGKLWMQVRDEWLFKKAGQ